MVMQKPTPEDNLCPAGPHDAQLRARRESTEVGTKWSGPLASPLLVGRLSKWFFTPSTPLATRHSHKTQPQENMAVHVLYYSPKFLDFVPF